MNCQASLSLLIGILGVIEVFAKKSLYLLQ